MIVELLLLFMFLAFPMPQNILGTIFLRLQLTLPTPQCMYHALTKLCSPNFYFAPITCCLAHTTKGVYYHALPDTSTTVNSFCQHPPRVSTSVL